MDRFVILQHRTPDGDYHWDIMFQCGESLRTFSAASEQIEEFCKTHHIHEEVRVLPDHREAYLHYEGPVSNNRGEVKRVDEGFFTPLPSPGKNPGRSGFQFRGNRISGTLEEIDRRWILEMSFAEVPAEAHDVRRNIQTELF